jgi:plastocyanin
MRLFRAFSSVGLAALIATASLAAACGDDDDDDGGDTGGTTSTATRPANGTSSVPNSLTKVTISDNKFTPANLQVPVGATVTWEWSGSVPHSVVGTFDGKEIKSPQLTGTGVYLEAFQKAGKFEYQCGVHGASMAGTITIQ